MLGEQLKCLSQNVKKKNNVYWRDAGWWVHCLWTSCTDLTFQGLNYPLPFFPTDWLVQLQFLWVVCFSVHEVDDLIRWHKNYLFNSGMVSLKALSDTPGILFLSNSTVASTAEVLWLLVDSLFITIVQGKTSCWESDWSEVSLILEHVTTNWSCCFWTIHVRFYLYWNVTKYFREHA